MEPESKRPTIPAKWTRTMVIGLLALQAFLAIHSLGQKSVTTDEIMYIAAGYYHLDTGRFDLNLTNPPLLKMWSALPLLLLDLELPPIADDPSKLSLVEQWQYSREFLYENRVDADRILFLARLPIVVLMTVLGLGVWAWSRRLYGDWAAILSTGLYALSPNILAHGRIATLDLGVTVFMFFAAWAFARWADRPGFGRIALAGMAFALGLLTKSTTVFLLPALALFGVLIVFGSGDRGDWASVWPMTRIPERRRRTRKLASAAVAGLAAALIGIVTIHVAYGFHGAFEPLAPDGDSSTLRQMLPGGNRLPSAVLELAARAPSPVPRPLLEVALFQVRQTSHGNRTYFAGVASDQGRWYLMGAATLLKTPLPLFALLGVALWMGLRRRSLSADECLLLSIVAIVFVLFSYLSQVSVGLRYLLPAWPCLHVLCGGVLRAGPPPHGRRIARALIAVLLVWYASAAIRVHPHYLAYFNEAAGGPSAGHRWLADSYLDWGQDLKGLRDYMEERGWKKIRLAYFGSADARYYGIDYDFLPSVGLAPTQVGELWWYEEGAQEAAPFEWDDRPVALSASLRAGLFFPDYYEWFRSHEPDDQIGHSILIYESPD